jgi:hypothetical protein
MRFLRYHYPDEDGQPRGLERVEPSIPQLNGTFVHQALELILTGTSLEEALDLARGAYLLGIERTDSNEFFVKEQLFLLECLVRAWVKVRLPVILAEYEVVSVEEELRWPMDSQIIDMVKCDVILRRRSDGLLFILEFKTTSSAREDWALQWECNTQVLLNTVAVQEMAGEPVGGMLIEGIIKGPHRRETAKRSAFVGMKIQHSPLCYGYMSPGGDIYSDYHYGWDKVALWDHTTPKAWVDHFSMEELDTLFFRPVGPIKPKPQDLMSVRRQVVAQEKKVARDVEKVLGKIIPLEPLPNELDEEFPKNYSHCLRYFGYPCSYMDLCYTGAVAEDPVGSGKYRWRRPHHIEEGEPVEGAV